MIVYTAQIAKWRQVKAMGVPFIDTTVKSGWRELAPHWDMVMGHKNGTMSDAEYTERYMAILDESFRTHPEFWGDLLASAEFCVACYCPNGAFCHRYLLINFLAAKAQEWNIDFCYRGEITSCHNRT